VIHHFITSSLHHFITVFLAFPLPISPFYAIVSSEYKNEAHVMRKRPVTIFVLALLLTTATGGLLIAPVLGSRSPTPDEIQREFQEAWIVASTHFAGDADITRVTQSAIQGMLATLDPHSNYLDPKDYAELREEQESRFYGIGVTINRRNGRVYILSIIEGSPAWRAGLRYGDAILSVDKDSAVNWSTAEVAKRVRGERNTTVGITVERVGEERPLAFRINRDAVMLPSISNAFMIRPTVGYIGLTRGFQGTTMSELSESINWLKDRGMTALIFDLRNNPGGLLTQAIQVAGRFLKRGEVILSVRSRTRERPPSKAAGGETDNFPLVVLINRYSASASEIVAGALQDHDRALIVGEPSFGKGLVQTVYPLLKGIGGALTLSTARYYTPSGRLIQRDYRGLSTYEYYTGRGNGNRGPAASTDGGRRVYGGGGIDPDVVIPTPNDPVRARIFGAVFEFVRYLVAGQIKGLEHFRALKPETLRSDKDLQIQMTEPVMTALRQFVQKRREFQVTPAELDANLTYARDRLQEEVVTARFGIEAGGRVALLHDEQALQAIAALPQAKELVEDLRRGKDKQF
jgi:carboxyl-terminal processing protease